MILLLHSVNARDSSTEIPWNVGVLDRERRGDVMQMIGFAEWLSIGRELHMGQPLVESMLLMQAQIRILHMSPRMVGNPSQQQLPNKNWIYYTDHSMEAA